MIQLCEQLIPLDIIICCSINLSSSRLHERSHNLDCKIEISVIIPNESDPVALPSTLALDQNGRAVTRLDQRDETLCISTLVGEDDYPVEKTILSPAPSGNPDGGLQAYLEVLGAHFLMLNSWWIIPLRKAARFLPFQCADVLPMSFRGIINALGVYQDYYEPSFLSSETPSAISWIGTTQAFLLAIAGSITGPIYDRGYFRHLLFTGTFLVTSGTMMTSLCSSYHQLVLAQGICVGLGAAYFWVLSAAIVTTYFDSKRNLMTAIAVTGSSIVLVVLNLSEKFLLTLS